MSIPTAGEMRGVLLRCQKLMKYALDHQIQSVSGAIYLVWLELKDLQLEKEPSDNREAK